MQEAETDRETKELEREIAGAQNEAETKEKMLRVLKKRVRKLMVRHKQEVYELEREYGADKTELLESIRLQNREIKRLEQILESVLPPGERQHLWEFAEWDEDQNRRKLPPFNLRTCCRCTRSITELRRENIALPGLSIQKPPEDTVEIFNELRQKHKSNRLSNLITSEAEESQSTPES